MQFGVSLKVDVSCCGLDAGIQISLFDVSTSSFKGCVVEFSSCKL